MKTPMESIPVGNGDIGANVWAKDNSIYLLLSKCDAFSRLHRLLKTGFIKLTFPEGEFNKKTVFHLSLKEGILRISAENLVAEIYADAFSPVYKINLEGKGVRGMNLSVINYRSKPEALGKKDLSNYQLNCEGGEDMAFDCTEDADVMFTSGTCSVGQYHCNGKSLYEFSLEHQHLKNYPDKNDFLTGHTFGFIAKSENMTLKNSVLYADGETEKVTIEIHSPVSRGGEKWLETAKKFPETDREKHREYWEKVWEKSYVYIEGGSGAKKITEGYIYQRYMHLLSGKGKFPIKFNGSIFTCQPSPHNGDNLDYRAWGGYYWLQNTRLIYWSMLFAGDYNLMKPFFRLYTDNLCFAKYRTEKYFGHSGAFYPETLSIFGAYADNNYGWKREGLSDGTTENTYIRYYYCGALEVALMMMIYCKNSGDDEFLVKECLPFVKEVILFFYEHFKTDEGKMLLKPTSSLETWHCCVNDSPTIAGLISVCSFAEGFTEASLELRELCSAVIEALPPMPFKTTGKKAMISPFESNIDTVKMNMENPELYPVFPYGLYKIGRENLDTAINTFKARKERASCGWQQHGTQAAFLGLRKEAFREIKKNAANTNKNCIFPAFYGPNYDWLPDQCNGSNLNMAVATSLVQYDNENIYLLPAWNKKLSVSFRLPAGDNFITVEYKRGKKPTYTFDKPEERKVVIM